MDFQKVQMPSGYDRIGQSITKCTTCPCWANSNELYLDGTIDDGDD